MDNKDILTKLKALNSAMSEFFDKMDIAEADEEAEKDCKKSPKKGKED